MEYIALVLILIVLISIIFIWVVYNKFVKQKNLIDEAWSAIDVTLKKRHDLVPNLIAVVKGISDHEENLFKEVTKWRAAAMQAKDSPTREEAENMLSSVLGKINVVIENYPTLVSGENYLKLQEQLETIEDEISYARRYYNGTIRNNNILLESFPSNLIGNMFNFQKPFFFEVETSAERNVPLANFSEDE